MANETEVDPELVKRASLAYNPHPKDVQAPALDAGLVDRIALIVSEHQGYRTVTEASQEVAMEIARVAADALLGPVTDEEIMQSVNRLSTETVQRVLTNTRWKDGIDIDEPSHAARRFAEHLIASRRARLLAPAKSAEERVTLDYCDGYTNIVLDNEVWMVVIETKKAEICAAGLIATLKQEGK